MPDKPVSSQSVGKAVVTLLRSLAFAGSVVVSAVALFAAGCTDDSGNGHFIPPGSVARWRGRRHGRRQRGWQRR